MCIPTLSWPCSNVKRTHARTRPVELQPQPTVYDVSAPKNTLATEPWPGQWYQYDPPPPKRSWWQTLKVVLISIGWVLITGMILGESGRRRGVRRTPGTVGTDMQRLRGDTDDLVC